MDLSSILSMTATVIQSVNDYSSSVKNAAKSCQSLKAELLSIQEILAELDNLVNADDGDVRCSIPNRSHHVRLTFYQDTLHRQLNIGGDGQLKKLQTTLDDISKWFQNLEPDTKKISLAQKVLWSSPAQQKKMKIFLSEMKEFKSTATLALTIASRYVY